MTRTDRRTVLLLGTGAIAAGCTSTSGPAGAPSGAGSSSTGPSSTAPSSTAPSSTAPSSTAPSSTASSAVQPLPGVTRWQPDGNDLSPRAKLAAVREVERRGTSGSTAVQVLDAQYGGLLPPLASVLVVTRSWRRRDGEVQQGGATYDVRVSRGSSGWRVTSVRPSRPGPAHRLTADERRVLTADRIVLPPAGRADVRSGQVHPSVLAAMLRLSQRYRIGVSVVRSGHPLLVFGTDRRSDHPQGRAFDTYRVDGELVVARSTPRRLVAGYMEAAAAAGSYNVGGPYLLGSAPQWFSDDTHHDHVHAGFSA